MESNLKVFFSNRVETLFQSLQGQLFAHSHPLTKRILIVPSAAMKSWLMLQMAQTSQHGIAAGIEMGFVDPSLRRLYTLLHLGATEGLCESSELELALAIESLIAEMIQTFALLPLQEQTTLRPLLAYLGVAPLNESFLSRRSAKRIGALSQTLAKLFVDYGKYGGKMLAEWAAENSHGKNSGWQQLLWHKLEKLFQSWQYPCRKFDSFDMTADFAADDLQIHLFGLSYLAPIYHRFLMQLSSRVPVYYYMLSPCQKFWHDVLSDKESLRLKKFWQRRQVALSQQEALEDFLRDNNPLLANFGKLGREMTMQLDASDPQVEDCYCLPHSVVTKEAYNDLLTPEVNLEGGATAHMTLLEALQADVVLLRNPEESERIAFSAYDGSVQIHAAPKPMREVQVIYDTILSIIEKHAHDSIPITPGDVVVMASNLTTYEPFIHAVFESQESCLAAHLIDVQRPAQNTFVQGFLHLLRLPQGRWEMASLLRLFEFPSFQAKHHIKPEDVQLLHQWVRAADIRWGKDPSHRNELLKRDHCAKDMDSDCWQGTWEHGLGRLLEGLAMLSPVVMADVDLAYAPIERIDASQGELLGNFLRLLRALQTDLKPLMGDMQLSLTDWSAYLKCLCDAYFVAGREKEEDEGSNLVLAQLATLKNVDARIKDRTFAFHSIQRHLEKAFQTHTSIYRESNLQAVRFCSLLPMRAVPAKVVILMGMGDGEFPRSEQALSLNLLAEHAQGDYYPSQMDFDRYLFLEALLSARNYFILSYVSQKPGNALNLSPSLLVTELLSYLDKAYSIPKGLLSQQCCRNHMLFAFHHTYFSADKAFQSYSLNHYRAATAYYHQEKNPSHTFLQNFLPQTMVSDMSSQDIVIDLADLSAFTRSPLKVYLNKALDIYLDRSSDRVLKKHEDLLLSPLGNAILLKNAMRTPVDAVLTHAKKSGALPSGPFRALEVARFKREVDVVKNNLDAHAIAPDALFSLEFNARYTEVKQVATGWQMPPLHLEVPQVGKVKLVGRLETVSMQGLVVLAEDDIKEAIKAWPSWLVFCCLVNTYALPMAQRLLFVKGKQSKAKEDSFSQPQVLLTHFLEYYFLGLKSPSPLLPECVQPIMVGNFDKVKDLYQTAVEDEFRPTYDEYLKWMKRSSPHTDIEAGNSHWQALAKKLFVDMTQAWYPKKGQTI